MGRADSEELESHDNNFIHAKINYLHTPILIDTGCLHSCISPEFANKLNLRWKPVQNLNRLFSANGTSIKVLGQVDVSINLSGLIVPYTFLVLENLVHPVMFGVDLLKDLRTQIDLYNNRISFYENLVTLPITKSLEKSVVLSTVSAVTIPAKCEALIPVRFQGRFNHKTAIVEPLPQLQSKHMLGARSVVLPKKNRTFCRILNAEDTPKYLSKHEQIARLSPVEVPANVQHNSNSRQFVNSLQRPPPLREMEQVLQELGLQIEKEKFSKQQYCELCTLIYSNRDIFAKTVTDLPGTTTICHHIDTGDAKPIRSRPYRHSLETRKEIARQIKEMYENDLIEPSMSAWSSPVILVKKANTKELRFTIDYRRLNSVSSPLFYPLPTMDEIRDRLADKPAKFYTLLDCRSGYHQVFLTQSSREKAAFCTSDAGNWQPKRLFFGLQGAPATYQMLMMRVLQGMQDYSLVYVDDCCIFSPDWSTHLTHLQSVFDRLRQHNLRLHPKKCFFALPQIRYLGHIISEKGIQPDEEKLQLIKKYPSPKSQKQLRSAMGLLNYYRRFQKDYAKKTECLRHLLQHNVPFEWKQEQEEAFQFLKDSLCAAPILAHADMTKQMILTTDGCSSGLGYVLSFKDDQGVEHPVEFAGRGLRPNEKKFGISEIECLAVLSGIQHFSPYLANKRFLLRTDHSALQFLKNIKNPSGRLARWAIYLSQYTFDVEYVPGKTLGNADALSRMPFHELPVAQAEPNFEVTDEIVVASIVKDNAQQQELGTLPNTTQERHLICLAPEKYTEGASCNVVLAAEPITNIAELQRECPDFKSIIQYLVTDELPQNDVQARKTALSADQFCMENGVLYHLSQPRGKKGKSLTAVTKQLCLPKTLRDKFVRNYHDHLSHPGFQKLYETMREKYWWPLQYTALHDYVSTCTLCQMTKRPVGLSKAPLEPLPVLAPFDMWVTDVLGPLPPDKDGNKYLLVCCDSTSLWPEAFPMRTCDAQTTAELLFSNIFCRFGTPTFLVADRGSNYTSQLMQALSKLCHVEQCFSTAYHHQTCGRAEQFMSTILKTFRLYCESDNAWSTHVDSVLLSYRALKTTVTKLSPYEVLYAKPMKLAIDTSVLKDIETSPDVDTYLRKLLPKLELAREIARSEHVAANEESKLYYDKNAAYPQYEQGSKVLLFDETNKPGTCRKMKRRWAGPYFVETKCPNYNFLLRHCRSGKIMKNPVHSNRLRPYRDDRSRFHQIAPRQPPVVDKSAAIPVTPPADTSEEWFEIHKLSRKKKVGGKTYYYVHWKDATNSRSWEPAENVTQFAIDAFEKRIKSRKRNVR